VTLLETAYPEPMLLGVVKRAERDAVAEIITASTPRFHMRAFAPQKSQRTAMCGIKSSQQAGKGPNPLAIWHINRLGEQMPA